MRLHELLNWNAIAYRLKELYQREISGAAGPESSPPRSIFKLMPLGQWHGLSDSQLEQALRVHPEFMVFKGFESAVSQRPDSITIFRFRNRLVAAKLN